MKNHFWQNKLAAALGEKFAKGFENLCDMLDLDEIDVMDKIYGVIMLQFDKENIIDWLSGTDYPSLGKNDKFISHFVSQYRKYYDNNIGLYDNIAVTFDYIKEKPEWKDVVDAAYEE